MRRIRNLTGYKYTYIHNNKKERHTKGFILVTKIFIDCYFLRLTRINLYISFASIDLLPLALFTCRRSLCSYVGCQLDLKQLKSD